MCPHLSVDGPAVQCCLSPRAGGEEEPLDTRCSLGSPCLQMPHLASSSALGHQHQLSLRQRARPLLCTVSPISPLSAVVGPHLLFRVCFCPQSLLLCPQSPRVLVSTRLQPHALSHEDPSPLGALCSDGFLRLPHNSSPVTV